MKNLNYLLLTCGTLFSFCATHAQHIQNNKSRLEAENYIFNAHANKVLNDNLSLKYGASQIGNDTESPSLVLNINNIMPGLYCLESNAITDEFGSQLMAKAKTKFESLFMEMQINNQPKTKRVVAVPWNNPLQELGKFQLAENNQIKIWLPKGVILDYIDIIPYQEPTVPEAVKQYVPKITPQNHPRLWVNKESLASVKNNLNATENNEKWRQISALAENSKPKPIYTGEVNYNEELEKIIEAKAFYYLMTGDKTVGKEAIVLAKDYIKHVSFGNILDITREIGRTIHITSEVYDWCYDLLSHEEKLEFITELKRLAIDMEIGWPPFLQPVVNGHGAEAQIHRDLLSMAIAIYDEDPIPYQYCAYRIFEELIPMRKFEYDSPRHNQGINYGAYRMNWDLHAAWLFKRMSGQEVFDANIKSTADYWLYFRLPDGQMLRDGDHALRSNAGEYSYWQINPTFTFMHYSYSNNPYLKNSFERMNTNVVNPILFLLLNDPNLKSTSIPTNYPLSKDFGQIIGGMVNRTGWEDNDIKSNNVIAELKGGGYFFSNHQHNDVGALQIYHKGFHVGDLGQYKFYGTPYDMNFTKRSVSHSVMLAVDPSEKIGNIPSNDGGTRMYRKVPNSPQELVENKEYHNGTVIASSPNDIISYFSVDLTSAYSDKIKNYQRDYVFINTKEYNTPAIIILKDKMKTASPAIKKYWQINTLNTPYLGSNNSIVLTNRLDSIKSYTHVDIIYPEKDKIEKKILSNKEAHNVFGFQTTPPDTAQFESHGHRILVSPIENDNDANFLSVFQVSNSNSAEFKPQYSKLNNFDVVTVSHHMIMMCNNGELIKNEISFSVGNNEIKNVYITGLQSGKWLLKNKKGKLIQQIEVYQGKHTTELNIAKGRYKLIPQ